MIARLILLFEKYVPDFMHEFIKFIGVGVFNTIVGFSLIMFFHHVVGLHYLLANLAGYMLALVVGYTMHSQITFRGRHAITPNEEDKMRIMFGRFRRFSLVFSISYALQFGCLYIMVDYFHLWVTLSQLVAMGVYVVASYIGNSFFTFRKTN